MRFNVILAVFAVLLAGIFGVFAIPGVRADAASFVTPSTGQPNYQTMYSSTEMSNYWPVLSGADAQAQCQSRQDILLQVAPLGCAPTVVRSDLLADQNVPVFCQIDALKINPLLQIGAIKGVQFTGKYPKEVVDVGFHPAKAALGANIYQPLPDPLLNNAGYVVVILKRNQNESSLPDFVTLNLTANIDYTAGNSLGVGNAEFKLRQLSDSDWESFGKAKSSFWGRYSLKLESATDNSAKISLYDGNRKVTTVEVEKGKRSSEIYMSGDYCQNSLQLEYRGFEADAKRATINVDGDKLEVYEKSKFLNGKCQVNTINVDAGGGTGKLTGQCSSKAFTLEIKGRISGGGYPSAFSYVPTEYNLGSRDATFKFENANYGYYAVKGMGITGEKMEWLVEMDISGNQGKTWAKETWPGGEAEQVKQQFSERSFKTSNFEYTFKFEKNGYKYYEMKRITDNPRILYLDYIGEIDSNKNLGSLWWEVGAWESSKALTKEAFLLAKGGPLAVGDKSLGAENDKAFSDAIAAYKKVAEDYRTAADTTGKIMWGETAMREAIELAAKAGKAATEVELINKYLDMYPEANATQGDSYRKRIDELQKKNLGNATVSLALDNSIVFISLLDLDEPSKKASASFNIGNNNNPITVIEGSTDARSILGLSLTLEKIIDANNVRVSCATYSVKLANAINTNIRSETTSPSQTTITKQLTVNSDGFTCGTYFVKLNKIDMDTLAAVGVIPSAKGTRTQTNLMVKIGIEKRAIQLSPEKTKEMIDNLNKSIERFGSISKTLGNVVKGLQGTCLATGTILTVTNFFTGLGGESIARQDVMRGANGWTKRCKDIIAGTKKTMSECFAENSNKIEADVAATTKAITTVNTNIDNIEKQTGIVTSNDIFGKTINSDAAKVQLANNLKSTYKGRYIGGMPIETALSTANVDMLSYNELREINLNLERQRLSGFSDGTKTGIELQLNASAARITELQKVREETQKLNSAGNTGIAPPSLPPVGNFASMTVYSVDSITNADLKAKISATGATHQSSLPSAGGLYLLGLKSTGTQNQYTLVSAVPLKDNAANGAALSDSELKTFVQDNKLGNSIITSKESTNCNNKMAGTVEISFYDTGQYKGLPHIVPFDRALGWYAATKPTLPASGAQGTFDLSGRVTSFWLCNVGANKQINFDESGYGDDICQQVSVNTGSLSAPISCLGETESRRKVQQATDAIKTAATNYGKSTITIGTDSFKVGKPAALISDMQCEDFMSPSSCTLLYNVCDPVICPSSRCDLGGRYPVKDVVQSGLIGSTLLCLPNFGNPSKGGVVIPVCLTGIQAGLDGYISILKNHRDCLQENLNTGKMTGICDQMYSFYKCDLIWKQVVPFATTIIPNLIGTAYGQSNVRGGGEYGTVAVAWENSKKSFNFFTQQYAGNLMKAFQAQSVEDVGTEFCKAYISANVPTKFGGLVEPESPPQFHGWFSSDSYSTATVPATAQYKAFYHIFAGNNAGSFYSVYLKNPPESSYYGTQQTIQIASGFVQKGQYASDTKDFTAPEGYKQMCIRVNQQEECGFGKVSTSFVVNQLSDLYVADQAKTQVTSESECSSGTRSFETAAVNTNLQAAIQEGLNPEIYKRGIVRICATSNPGSSTDATRYLDVGFCGDQKVRCWLDKNSVQNAIKDLGTRNETITQLQNNANQKLIQSGAVLSPNDMASEIRNLSDRLADLRDRTKTPDSQLKQKAASLRLNIEAVLAKAYMNGDKAQMLLIDARVLAHIFDRALGGILASAVSPVSQTATTAAATTVQTAQAQIEQTAGMLNQYQLSAAYDPSKSNIHILTPQGKDLSTSLIINNGKIYLNGQTNPLGTITDKKISLLNAAELYSINEDLFFNLNGATIGADNQLITSQLTNLPISYPLRLTMRYDSTKKIYLIDSENKNVRLFLRNDKVYLLNYILGNEPVGTVVLKDGVNSFVLDASISDLKSYFDFSGEEGFYNYIGTAYIDSSDQQTIKNFLTSQSVISLSQSFNPADSSSEITLSLGGILLNNVFIKNQRISIHTSKGDVNIAFISADGKISGFPNEIDAANSVNSQLYSFIDGGRVQGDKLFSKIGSISESNPTGGLGGQILEIVPTSSTNSRPNINEDTILTIRRSCNFVRNVKVWSYDSESYVAGGLLLNTGVNIVNVGTIRNAGKYSANASCYDGTTSPGTVYGEKSIDFTVYDF